LFFIQYRHYFCTAPPNAAIEAPQLVRLTQEDRSPAVCCGRGADATLLACRPALVDPAALASSRVSLPGGLTLGLTNGVPAGRSDRVGYHFTNPAAGAEAVFTYNPKTGRQTNFMYLSKCLPTNCAFQVICISLLA
jgi:hypothetical protein